MHRFPTLGLLAALGFGLSIPLAGPVAAQDLPPGVEGLIQGLRPEAGATRGIRLPAAAPSAAPVTPLPPAAAPARPTAAAPTAAAPATAATTAPPGVAAVSLMVNFPSGSAALTPQAEQVLGQLAAALRSPELMPFRFRIEGHTDTVGSRGLNQGLSEQRANAVRDHLIRRHGIAANRLEAIGLGEQQLLVETPDEMAEPRNRRVQILNLGG